MGDAFGQGVFYEADGWFDSQTGPWAAGISSGGLSFDTSSSKDSVGGCIGGFVIPSYSEGQAHASAVSNTIFAANDSSTMWVYQGDWVSTTLAIVHMCIFF